MNAPPASVFAVRLTRAVQATLPLVAIAAAVGPAVTDGPLGVTAATIAAVNCAYAIALMRRAARGRDGLDTDRAGGHGTAGDRDNLLAVGLWVSGTVGAAVALLSALGEMSDSTAWFAFGGLAAATLAYLPAMVIGPGSPTSVAARLRCGLDGLSVGVCALFTMWVLVIAPNGALGDHGFWVALLTGGTLGVAAATGLRSRGVDAAWWGTDAAGGASGTCPAARGRRAGRAFARTKAVVRARTLTRTGAGARTGAVGLSVTGLAGLTLTVTAGQAHVPLAIFAAALVAAPMLAWRGVRAPDAPGPAAHQEPRTAFPALVVPAAAAIVVAVHRLATGGDFDEPSVLLGVLGSGAVALRETFAAADVSRYARRVVEQEATFRHLIAGSTDVIMVLDGDLVVRWQSPAASRQFGLSDRDVVGRHLQSMVHPEDAVLVADRLGGVAAGAGTDRDRPVLIEARLRDGSGRWRETESAVSDQRGVPAVNGLVVHLRDVGERKEMQRTLRQLALADQLTGLANRRQVLSSITALRSAPQMSGALLVLELDGFAAVNAERGHGVGDAVLVEVARRLRAGVIESDLPARLSGGEFAVVTEVTPVRAYALATRLLATLAVPFVVDGATVHLTASIGMTDLAGGSSYGEVLRRADLALRRAKQLGRGRVEWFDEAVEEALPRRMTLEMDLPGALLRGELDVIYQPILDLVQARPIAVEALLRWRHPTLSTLLPVDIIPVAEDLGLINEIGGWVIYRATRQLAAWRRDGRDLSMMVNVSPHQLVHTDLLANIAAVLEINDLPADRLVLEVCAGGLPADPDRVCGRLRDLRAVGVRTALGELGTGPASLSHLRRLPLDLVKVGRSSFDEAALAEAALDEAAVDEAAVDEAALAEAALDEAALDEATPAAGSSGPIIDAMVGLGRRLGVEVVAQGMETSAHLAVVRAAGCRLGQGHLFARPQPAERTEAYLDGFRAPSH